VIVDCDGWIKWPRCKESDESPAAPAVGSSRFAVGLDNPPLVIWLLTTDYSLSSFASADGADEAVEHGGQFLRFARPAVAGL